jgi:hypothetical protein
VSHNAPFFRAGRSADTEMRKTLSLRPFVADFEVAEVLQIVGPVSLHIDIEQVNDRKFECGYASGAPKLPKRSELPKYCKKRAAAVTVTEPAVIVKKKS